MTVGKERVRESQNWEAPTDAEVIEVRGIFAHPGELFVTNILIDPYNSKSDDLDKVSQELSLKYPRFDLRLEDNYIVDPDGLILDSKNYARWNHVPDGEGFAVYARVKGTELGIYGPKQSEKLIMDLIKSCSSGFTLVNGEEAWRTKIVDKAKELFGDDWRREIY